MFYNYHGIFAELNRTNAAVVIQERWRLCRYNPIYDMCEKVTTRNYNEILENVGLTISIDNKNYNKKRLQEKQIRFRIDVEKTIKFNVPYNT